MSVGAIPLGEDGGSWFVEDKDGSTDEKAIRRAVLNLLQEQYGNLAADDYITEVEELATAELTYKTGWWATGHREGTWVQDEDPPEKVSGWFIN